MVQQGANTIASVTFFLIFRNRVALTFNFLTTGPMHAEALPRRICVPRLVLIAQVTFLLEHGHTNALSQMSLFTLPTHPLALSLVVSAAVIIDSHNKTSKNIAHISCLLLAAVPFRLPQLKSHCRLQTFRRHWAHSMGP